MNRLQTPSTFLTKGAGNPETPSTALRRVSEKSRKFRKLQALLYEGCRKSRNSGNSKHCFTKGAGKPEDWSVGGLQSESSKLTSSQSSKKVNPPVTYTQQRRTLITCGISLTKQCQTYIPSGVSPTAMPNVHPLKCLTQRCQMYIP